MTIAARLEAASSGLQSLRPYEIIGEVSGIAGLALELQGMTGHLSIGDRVWVRPRTGPPIQAEAIGSAAASPAP